MNGVSLPFDLPPIAENGMIYGADQTTSDIFKESINTARLRCFGYCLFLIDSLLISFHSFLFIFKKYPNGKDACADDLSTILHKTRRRNCKRMLSVNLCYDFYVSSTHTISS